MVLSPRLHNVLSYGGAIAVFMFTAFNQVGFEARSFRMWSVYSRADWLLVRQLHHFLRKNGPAHLSPSVFSFSLAILPVPTDRCLLYFPLRQMMWNFHFFRRAYESFSVHR